MALYMWMWINIAVFDQIHKCVNVKKANLFEHRYLINKHVCNWKVFVLEYVCTALKYHTAISKFWVDQYIDVYERRLYNNRNLKAWTSARRLDPWSPWTTGQLGLGRPQLWRWWTHSFPRCMQNARFIHSWQIQIQRIIYAMVLS